jgi:hypothetical protein
MTAISTASTRRSCPGVATKIAVSNVVMVTPRILQYLGGIQREPHEQQARQRSRSPGGDVREIRPFGDVIGGHAR